MEKYVPFIVGAIAIALASWAVWPKISEVISGLNIPTVGTRAETGGPITRSHAVEDFEHLQDYCAYKPAALKVLNELWTHLNDPDEGRPVLPAGLTPEQVKALQVLSSIKPASTLAAAPTAVKGGGS